VKVERYGWGDDLVCVRVDGTNRHEIGAYVAMR